MPLSRLTTSLHFKKPSATGYGLRQRVFYLLRRVLAASCNDDEQFEFFFLGFLRCGQGFDLPLLPVQLRT
jgi:hypothetical protein